MGLRLQPPRDSETALFLQTGPRGLPCYQSKSTRGASDVDRIAGRCRFFLAERFAGLADKMKEELPSYLAAVAMIKPPGASLQYPERLH